MRNFQIIILFLILNLLNLLPLSKHSWANPKPYTYRFSLANAITSLDPQTTADIYSTAVQSLTYEGLYEYQFNSSPLKLQPALAAKMPLISPDGRTYTITLKSGIRFQDDPCFVETKGRGREFQASDVVKTLERLSHPSTASPSFGEIAHIIEGAQDFHDGKTKTISGVKAIDKLKVQFQLTKPFPRFTNWLAMIHAAILPVECVAYYKDEWPNHSVGTGAFRITSFNRLQVVAVKNIRFRGQSYKGHRLPLVDRVEVEVIPEENTRWMKFKAGQIDTVQVPRDSFDDMKQLVETKNIQHFSQTKSDVVFLYINLRDKTFAENIALRQALALSLDKEELIRISFGGPQGARKAESILPPHIGGAITGFRSRWKGPDLDQARKLIAQAGYPNGKGLPEIVFTDAANTLNRQVAEAISRQWAKIGLRVSPQLLAWPELTERRKQGLFSVSLYSWVSDYSDADNHLQIFTKKSFPPHGVNYSGFSNDQYDRLVEDISQMKDGPIRKKAITEALDILDAQLPLIPLAHRIGNRLFQPWVKNGSFVEETLQGAWVKYRGVSHY